MSENSCRDGYRYPLDTRPRAKAATGFCNMLIDRSW